jgi:hypothetical protein
MKKGISIILIYLLCSPGLFAETLYGLELAPAPMREAHLNHFMQLFKEFCLEQKSQQDATTNLLNSGRFRPAEGYEGTYEEFFEGLSYAVTPDPDVCTVDVLLEYQSGRLLFSPDGMRKKILGVAGYYLAESSREIADGPSAERVQTIEFHFHKGDTDRNKISLTYPLSDQDVYFMTLNYHYD